MLDCLFYDKDMIVFYQFIALMTKETFTFVVVVVVATHTREITPYRKQSKLDLGSFTADF